MTHPLEERAGEFLSPYFDMLDDLGPIKMNRDAHAAKLAASYAQVQAEARLEEAKWWDSHDDDTEADATAKVSRLAALAQAAAPVPTSVRYCGHEVPIGKPCPLCWHAAAAPAKET